MLFRFNGYDSKGIKTKGNIEANTINEAKLKLRAKGIIYTSLVEDNFNISNMTFKRKKSLTLQSLSNLSRDLSIYLSSGLSLMTSVGLMKQRYKKDKTLSNFFESIQTNLDEGKNFYTSLEKQSILKLPIFFKQSIKISENGGLLESVLMELSIFLKSQDRVKKQVSQALAYPILILTVSFFMVGFMLSFIVPKITNIFIQLDQELPWSTVLIINLGNFFSNYIEWLLLGVIALSISFLYLLKKSEVFRYSFDKLILKIPFFRSLIEHSELARFSYMNSVLIKSGVPIVQAFNLSANILKNSVIKKVFISASANVVEGKKLSSLLANNSIFDIDEAFIQAISIGEDTSKLAEILNNQAELYNESNKDKIAMFLALLEPLFMLFVGTTIGFIVISMLLPIFSMNLG